MALIRDISLILQKMRSDNMPYYRVKDSDNKSVIDLNDDPGTGLDAAIENLRTTLENIDGLVHVTISQKTSKDKAAGGDTRQCSFSIKLGNSPVPGIGAAGAGGFGQMQIIMDLMRENFTNQMAMLTQKFEDQVRYKELERKIGEAGEDNKNDFIYLALKKLDRMIPDHPQQQLKPAIHGTGEVEKKPFKKVEMNEEEQKKLNLAIHVLLEKDPKFIDHITMLAKMAQQDPDIYEMAIKKLEKLS